MAIPTPRLMIYREKASQLCKLQPSALEEATGAQPECGKAKLIENPERNDVLARAVLKWLPRSMKPIGADRLVLESVEERRRWVKEHDAVFVEMPSSELIRVVPFPRDGRHYVSGRTIKVSTRKLKLNLSRLTKALVAALRRASL